MTAHHKKTAAPRKFTPADIEEMERLRRFMNLEEIGERFGGVSARVVSRHLLSHGSSTADIYRLRTPSHPVKWDFRNDNLRVGD